MYMGNRYSITAGVNESGEPRALQVLKREMQGKAHMYKEGKEDTKKGDVSNP